MADKKKKSSLTLDVVSAKTMTNKEKAKRVSEVIEKRKGCVFAYAIKAGKGTLVRLEKTEKKEGRTKKQLKEDRQFWKEKGLLSPPYDPDSFLDYYESNVYFMRTVDQIAQDVAGQGYKLEPREGIEEDKDEKAKKFKDAATKFLDDPCDGEYSLQELIKRLITDWGCIGWYNMEIVRTGAGAVGSLFHVPAYTVKIHESEDKYCQTRYIKGKRRRVWFKKFGLKEEISEKDGEEKKGIKEEDAANEMLMDNCYFIRSDYYGVPKIISSIGAVISMIGIRDFNLSFLENFGVPAALVILYGDWNQGADTELTDFIENEIRGSENAYKTLVMQAPEGREATGEKKGIEWIPLMADFKAGSIFTKDFYKMLRDEILVAYSMPPYRIGIAEEGSLGGSTAEQLLDNYVSSIVENAQKSVEDIFNVKLLPSLQESGDQDEKEPVPYKFNLIPPDIKNQERELKRSMDLFDRSALTVDELRAVEGKEAFGKENGGEERFMLKGYRNIKEEDLENAEEGVLRIAQEMEGRLKRLEEKE